jgi:RimJ/RimL family protein N-acetyltransferase
VSEIDLRAIRPEDSDALAEFHERLSPESQYFRYFSSHPHLLARELHRFTEVDGHDRAGVVAVLDDRIVGWAEYDRIGDSTDVEIAVVVDDAFQEHGLGTRLVAWLADHAASSGFTTLVANTLPDNRRMRLLMHDLGLTATTFQDGVVRVCIPAPAT